MTAAAYLHGINSRKKSRSERDACADDGDRSIYNVPCGELRQWVSGVALLMLRLDLTVVYFSNGHIDQLVGTWS